MGGETYPGMVYALGLIGLGEELAAALVHAFLRHGVWLEWKQEGNGCGLGMVVTIGNYRHVMSPRAGEAMTIEPGQVTIDGYFLSYRVTVRTQND